MNYFPQLIVFILTTLLLQACSTPRNEASSGQVVKGDLTVDLALLQPLAVQYRTTLKDPHHDAAQLIHWRLLRRSDYVEIYHQESAISDIWRRTSKDLWFYEKAFHNDKTVIEYTPNDLDMLNIEPQWSRLATGIDPAILEALSVKRSGKPVFGHASVELAGTINDIDYRVIWLPDLKLVARVEQVAGDLHTVTELNSPNALTDASGQATEIRNYRLIDYADLGDMERDPFVMQVQSEIVGGHPHH